MLKIHCTNKVVPSYLRLTFTRLGPMGDGLVNDTLGNVATWQPLPLLHCEVK